MTKTTYAILIPRRYAILYAAWEYGVGHAVEQVDRLPTDRRGWIDVSRAIGDHSRLLRDARSMARRVAEAISYQEGRLGRRLTGGGGLVKVTRVHG